MSIFIVIVVMFIVYFAIVKFCNLTEKQAFGDMNQDIKKMINLNLNTKGALCTNASICTIGFSYDESMGDLGANYIISAEVICEGIKREYTTLVTSNAPEIVNQGVQTILKLVYRDIAAAQITC